MIYGIPTVGDVIVVAETQISYMTSAIDAMSVNVCVAPSDVAELAEFRI